jgi:hypothetical protein
VAAGLSFSKGHLLAIEAILGCSLDRVITKVFSASQGGEVNVFKYIILCNVRITNKKYCKNN